MQRWTARSESVAPRQCTCGRRATAYVWGSWLCDVCLEEVYTPQEEEGEEHGRESDGS
jgi:hypothetical protein